MAFSHAQISAVAELFKPEDENSDSDEELMTGPAARLGPGSIGPVKSEATADSADTGDSKDIWAEAEVQEGSEFDSVHDPRPQPEYDIIYSQDVTSEDIFLQMGNKTPATSSCQNMTVKIKLPDTKMADVDLDVKAKFLDCRTPKYKLGLHLPHPVDHKNGRAKFDTKSETLCITLKMVREYDMFNF